MPSPQTSSNLRLGTSSHPEQMSKLRSCCKALNGSCFFEQEKHFFKVRPQLLASQRLLVPYFCWFITKNLYITNCCFFWGGNSPATLPNQTMQRPDDYDLDWPRRLVTTSGHKTNDPCGLLSAWVEHTSSYIFQHMGVSKNMGTPKWIVYNGKPY